MQKKTKQPKRLQLQIPLELYNEANTRSDELGFNSINQVMKLMLQGFVKKEISFGFFNTTDTNSAPFVDLNTEKRIAENVKEYREGKVYRINMKKNSLEQLKTILDE